MGLRWGLNPRPEQNFSHENAGKKKRAQINVWIRKKGSDDHRRKCCLLWVTIHTNSNFLSVPHLGNNCHGTVPKLAFPKIIFRAHRPTIDPITRFYEWFYGNKGNEILLLYSCVVLKLGSFISSAAV